MTNTTPGLSFMNEIKAQIEAEPRFQKLGGSLELRQLGGGENPDKTPYLHLVFVKNVQGAYTHEYVHSVNTRQDVQARGSEHTHYGEFSVVMVSRGRGGKAFHGCPVDQTTRRLMPEGMDKVLSQLKSGLTKYKKLIPALDGITAKYSSPATWEEAAQRPTITITEVK